MTAGRLTPKEWTEAVRIAQEATAEADKLRRTGSEYYLDPYCSLDMVDLLARALLEARDRVDFLEDDAFDRIRR
jgi:hypothetical protein